MRLCYQGVLKYDLSYWTHFWLLDQPQTQQGKSSELRGHFCLLRACCYGKISLVPFTKSPLIPRPWVIRQRSTPSSSPPGPLSTTVPPSHRLSVGGRHPQSCTHLGRVSPAAIAKDQIVWFLRLSQRPPLIQWGTFWLWSWDEWLDLRWTQHGALKKS